jgi:membrane-associated phospholipid phosphatase
MKLKYLPFIALIYFLILDTNILSQNIDYYLLKSFHQERNTRLDPLMGFLSNTTLPVLAIVPAGIGSFSIIKRDTTNFFKSIDLASSVFVSGVIAITLKSATNRKRPVEKYDFVEPFKESNTSAFPSGHTSLAFSLATSMTINYPKWYVVLPSYLWAGLVGYSRIHTGAHHATDVFYGAIIGSGSAFLSYKLNKYLLSKYRKTN